MFNKTSQYSTSSHKLTVVLVAAAAILLASGARATEADAPMTFDSAAVRTIAFAAPVEGYAVNSRFGMRRLSYEPRARMHEGLDYAAPTGTPVLSAADGVVLRTGDSSSYGRFVEVAHPNGVTSFYAHLSRVDVGAGDRLQAGEELGKVGATGRVTGPHLHFEIRQAGQQIDPAEFLGRSFALETLVPESEPELAPYAYYAASRTSPNLYRTVALSE